jgi:hypothetical protein
MVIFKVILIWSVLAFTKTTERFGLKTVSWVSVLIVMILFGDSIIPAIFHVLHVFWEIIESVVEHFLESQFHLTPRQAEFIVAWMGILTMFGAGVKILFVAYRYSILLFFKVQYYFNVVKADLEANPLKLGLWLSIVSLGTYGSTFLFL